MEKILIVDDFEGNRDLLKDMLWDFFSVDTAENGKEAIEKITSDKNYNAMLLDLMMPEMDGFEVLDYMNEHHLINKIPVIIISGDSNAETESNCLDLGVADFIAKPFKEKIIQKRVNNVISLHEYQNSLEGEIRGKNKELEQQNVKLREQAYHLEEINSNIIDILGNIVESRNLESGTHVKRVRNYTKILGMQVMKDFPEYKLTDERINHIAQASALHDIGKISIPDSILLKPGRLDSNEFEIMKTHTTIGCEILEKVKGIWDQEYHKTSWEICRYHHEKYDGKGYPEGLKGEEIPLSAQLVSIADCYDALTTKRVYKEAFSSETAFKMILNGECGAFSPKLLKSFENARSDFEDFVLETNLK